MRITLTLNKEAITNKSYESSEKIIQEFQRRGHEVFAVPPTEIQELDGIVNGTHYSFEEKRFISKGFSPVRGEVVLVRSLGEDAINPQDSYNFIFSLLPKIQRQVDVCINDAQSTSWEYKPKQKTLNLPFIPSFQVNSKRELESLLEDEEIIAKPAVGLMGGGVLYLKGKKTASQISEDRLNSYCFERFISAESERRYLFLGENIIISRDVERIGSPGNEKYGKRTLVKQSNPREIAIIKEVMKLTGMVYGCVDFRNEYVLEINGSGTGTCVPNEDGTEGFGFVSTLVDFVEKKAFKK